MPQTQIEETPSIRSEASTAVLEIIGLAPPETTPDGLITLIRDGLKQRRIVRETEGARGSTQAVKEYRLQENYWAQAARRRAPLALVPPPVEAPPPAPVEPPRPLTKTQKLLQRSQGTLPVPTTAAPAPATRELTEEEEKEVSALYDPEEDRRRLQLNKFKTALGVAIGDYAHDRAKGRFNLYLEPRGDNEDPMDRVDTPPFVMAPRDLVPEGEGEDFAKLILFIESFNVPLPDGRVAKRDFKLNNRPALQNHPQLIHEIDGNMKIRSTKRMISGKEYAFFTKAFWVKDGDLLHGYLNLRGKGDQKDMALFFRIEDGKVLPISRDEYTRRGGQIVESND